MQIQSLLRKIPLLPNRQEQGFVADCIAGEDAPAFSPKQIQCYFPYNKSVLREVESLANIKIAQNPN